MRSTGGARGARALEILAVAALFTLIGALCLTRTTDTDLWWHLATGDLIRSVGEVPRADPFSYTARGHPWIDQHWLFQAALSSLYAAGGLPALDVLKVVLILGLFGFLYARGRRLAQAPAVLGVLIVAALACQERFLMRPEIVSWLLMATVIAALEAALDEDRIGRRRVILWLALPLVQVVWVNVQGLFMLGPALLSLALLACAARLLRRPVPPREVDRAVDLLVALAILVVACLANPNGSRALRLPLEQFFVQLGGESLLSRTIAEFRPPLSGYLVTPSIVAFIVVAVAAGLAILANLGRVRPFDGLLALATLYVALVARRNIPIFVIAAVPVLLRNGAAAFRMWSFLRQAGWPLALTWRPLRPAPLRPPPRLATALLAAVSLLLTQDVVSNRFFLRVPTERWWGIGLIPHYFPDEAASYVAASKLPGQVFHSLWAGGYLIHSWKGQRSVFIDGRNDPYLGGVLETYLRITGDPEAFEAAARRYQITAVLWPHQRALEARALLAYLARGEGWVLARLDPAAAVFVRADVAPPELVGGAPPAGIAAGSTGTAAGPDERRRQVYEDLARRLQEAPFDGPPIREIALGHYFSVTGDPRGAEFFLKRAVDRLPRSATILHDYALALERQGRLDEARAAYEAAAAADPGFLPVAGALGALLADAGEAGRAERLLEKAYLGGERGVVVLAGRAHLYESQGKVREAVASYQEALRAAPRNPALLRDIALFHLRHGEEEAALPYYARAAALDPGDPLLAREMAGLLEDLGRISAALDVARDGARRALGRIRAGTGGEEDRRLLSLAARLETRSGFPERASDWLAPLTPPR